MLETNKHFEIFKTSLETFKNNAYTKLTPTINNFSLVYDQITGRQAVRQAGVDLLQVIRSGLLFIENDIQYSKA